MIKLRNQEQTKIHLLIPQRYSLYLYAHSLSLQSFTVAIHPIRKAQLILESTQQVAFYIPDNYHLMWLLVLVAPLMLILLMEDLATMVTVMAINYIGAYNLSTILIMRKLDSTISPINRMNQHVQVLWLHRNLH